jgi:hypothetical protein
MLTWTGIVGKSCKPDEFEKSFAGLKFGLWRTSSWFTTASAPDLKTWNGWRPLKANPRGLEAARIGFCNVS